MCKKTNVRSQHTSIFNAYIIKLIVGLVIFRDHEVDVVTLGQYMRPTKKHMAVEDFVTPEAFDAFGKVAESMGFLYVASGPMVRSSYRAGELYLSNVLRGDKPVNIAVDKTVSPPAEI